MFITFEGGEGTGKSTQVKLLCERLRLQGRSVVTTREPGGTPAAEEIRSLLINGAANKWQSQEEALLIYAARSSHLREIILPALLLDKVVICDRFMDSTRAYQHYAGTCTLEFLVELERTIVASTRPYLTFVFDLDPIVGLQRARQRGADSINRYERKEFAFHTTVREAFLTIARAEPERCKIIDASLSQDEVSSQIWQIIGG